MTPLRFLHFDVSGDPHERVTLEAMASVSAHQWPALQAEACQLLAWLHRQHADLQGTQEDGGAWDVQLRGSTERSQDMGFEFVQSVAQLEARPESGERVRHTLDICLSVAPWLAEALDAEFGTGTL